MVDIKNNTVDASNQIITGILVHERRVDDTAVRHSSCAIKSAFNTLGCLRELHQCFAVGFCMLLTFYCHAALLDGRGAFFQHPDAVYFIRKDVPL
jgi:hypothetical protein